MQNPTFQVKEEFYKSKAKKNELLHLKRREEREEHERKKTVIRLRYRLN
jgi:hypothetical protein